MTVELGHFALVLAFVVACWQMLVPLYGAWVGNSVLMQQGRMAAVTQCALIAVSFVALTHAYLVSDFSVLNVAENSHSAKPLIYKISGVWGNHEGSMLLWVLILSLFGAAVAVFGSHLPASLRARVLSVQGSIGVAFLLFILFASNPFIRLANPPIQGNGLNPILQDPALAFHPPFLYAGYVGLSISFSFAVAALLEGKVDAAWARWVRPWTLLSWAMLTIGIAMGSWWAYYELGWGGFWFWDPVENASFMPWLISTALLHSAIVVEKRGALKIWTILLSILAFSLSLVGTFLVRSGVLTSVHAFAVDPERGLYILMILGVFIGGSLTLFAIRAPSLKVGGLFAPVSREGGLVLNNLEAGQPCSRFQAHPVAAGVGPVCRHSRVGGNPAWPLARTRRCGHRRLGYFRKFARSGTAHQLWQRTVHHSLCPLSRPAQQRLRLHPRPRRIGTRRYRCRHPFSMERRTHPYHEARRQD